MRFSLEQHQTSQPLAIAVGNVIMVTPGTGATALVEYTTGSAVQIANYTATWTPWSFGTVSVATRDSVAAAGFARVTTIGGPVTIDVRGALEELQVARITTDSLGSPVGLIDPKGTPISSGAALATISGTYVLGQTLTAKYPAGITGTIQFTRTSTTSPFTKTAISGAVANAVNSFSYTLQQADVGFIPGIDCSNQVSSAVGSIVGAGFNNLQQAMRTRANDNYTQGKVGICTSWFKVEFDQDFNIAQWMIVSGVTAAGSRKYVGTPGTYSVQFAVTDTIAVDTVNNAFLPTRAGVVYNDTSANGWQNATFGGAASKQIGFAPDTPQSWGTASMLTDALPLQSIPRADGKQGGILLVKVVQTDSTAALTTEGSTDAAWDAARGSNSWFREFFSCRRDNVNGITSVTGPTSAAEGSTGYGIAGYPIVTTSVGVRQSDLIMFTGDSRKSAAYSTYAFNNPNRQAVMSLSSPAHPLSIVDAAGSGHQQSEYLAVAMDQLNNGLRPTVIYLPGFSQNGFVDGNTFVTANANFMSAVRALPGMSNVKFILDTDYYVKGYVGTSKESGRQYCIAQAKALANNVNVFLFDSDPIMTDYSTPSAPVLKAALMNADGTHANQAGQDAMTYGDGTYPGLQLVYKTVLGIA